LRASLMVEEIQVGTDRDVEIAFSTTPLLGPPPGWTMAAERIWQLDRPHPAEELALYADMPPLLPCLVTLGQFEGGQLYCNLENHPGINVGGDAATAQEWVTSVVWEVAGGGFAEHPTVLLVDVDVAGVAILDAVEHVTATEGLARFAEPAPSTDRGMLDRRTEQFDGWDTTLVVLGAGVEVDAWSQIAARQNVAVISLGAVLPDGLELVIDAGRVTVPRWNLTVEAVGLSAHDADRVAELLDAADAPPVPDELEIPVITEDTPLPVDDPGAVDAVTDRDGQARWEPPLWPVTVRLLAGAPRVAAAGGELRVKPQPLAGLAYLAIYREVALDDLRSAIWGDDQQVKPQRLRDLLSELRKQLGGAQVVGHIEDGVVRAGPELGCDLAVFEALAERARQVPAEAGQHLAAMVDLVEGPPFAYPSSAAAYWRWVDLSHLHAVWQHRLATAAYELAELHLSRDDPNAALRVAERGLLADPFNGPLTEMVITAYGRLGAYDTARRVFEAHDRALTDRDLGGASDETRRVLDHLLMATATAPNGDTSSPADNADRRAVAG
jgi:DNA-binding SARP family transcriptional activator